MGEAKVLADSRDRTAWLAARRTVIGASDLPRLLGLRKWGGPLSVYRDKVLGEEVKETPKMRRGTDLEPMVGAAIAKMLGGRWETDGKLYQSPLHPRLGATVDGRILDIPGAARPPVGEIKTTEITEDWDAGVPEYVQAQNQGQMAVLIDEPDIVVGVRFIEEWDDFWKRVPRNERFIHEVVLPAVDNFWANHVIPQIPPDPLPLDSDLRALVKLYPEDTGRSLQLPPEMIPVYDEWRRSAEVEAENKKRKEGARDILVAALKGATFGALPDGRRLSNKITKRAAYSVAETTYTTLRALKG